MIEKILKSMVVLVLLLVGLLAFVWYGVPYWLPSELRGVRVITADANQMIVDHAGGVQRQLASDNSHKRDDTHKTIDLDAWRARTRPKTVEVAKAQTLREAELAVGTRRLPIRRKHMVAGNQKGFMEMFTASEPLLVVFSENERMCSAAIPSDCWTVNGIYADGTPTWQGGNKTILQDPAQGGHVDNHPGAYGAVVIRTCTAGGCSAPAMTGATFAACPAQNQSTAVMLTTNRYSLLLGIPVWQDFNADGDFSFEVLPWDHPDAGNLGKLAKIVCDANPSAGFVRL